MYYIKRIIISMVLMTGLATLPGALAFSGATVAADAKTEICNGINGTPTCNASGANDPSKYIKNIINIILYVIGAIAVLMIVIGGLRYVISGGDSSQTKNAKDTILYAVIGLVIALMAYAIVNFVVLNTAK